MLEYALLLGSVTILTLVFVYCMGEDIYKVKDDMLELWDCVQKDSITKGLPEISHQDIEMIYHGTHVDVSGDLMFRRDDKDDKCLIIFDESLHEREPIDSDEEEVFRIIQFASDEWIDLHAPWSFTHDEEYLQEKAFAYYVENDYFKTVDYILSTYLYRNNYSYAPKVAIKHSQSADMLRLVLDHSTDTCWNLEDVYHRVCRDVDEVSRTLLDEYISPEELVEESKGFTYAKNSFWKNMIDMGYNPDASDIIEWLDLELFLKIMMTDHKNITPTVIRLLLKSDKNYEIAKVLKDLTILDDLDLTAFTVPKKGCGLYWMDDDPYLVNYDNPKITKLLCDDQSNWIPPT